MKFMGIILAAIVSIAFAAPSIDNTIKSSVTQLECVTKTILSIDRKHKLGDLWQPIYFPMLMYTNSIYECLANEDDVCVEDEMSSVLYTLADFLDNIRVNNSGASQEIHDALTAQCKLDVPEFEYMENAKKIDFKKLVIKIEHVLCVTRTIINEISKSDDALNWIQYHLELKDSVVKMVACNKYVGMDKNMCIIRELRTTIEVIFKLWQFLSEKKHIQVIAQIKGQIKEQCQQKPF
ncbi:uncharacterized protein LOC116352361 [Contarinia nasturtii]|uniref:uncharacterized protein LOC116352361 n=1 Tax=Contarinia nasturtii TaxID=265458 RepID=UPI0012D46827|nr:uncharacterized protein LOC116352361 [Contarinia nasturtii]